MSHLCHDFKSPRPDSSQRLPQIYMLVPALFYLVLLGGSYLGITSYLGYREALKSRDSWVQQQADFDTNRMKYETELTEVTKEKFKAEKLAQWVEGTRSLQPISVAIARALPPEITIAELSLERSPELPQQVGLTVLINNGTLEDVNRIQSAVGLLNYRPFNSQQSKAGEALEYKSMLVWQQF
ncbi:hypothetical protein [Verrucomicrobium sp. BvORR034]|uniref:hypothetical protein n=1 Tax=Verrucomicrobium sp. BvORR034 TaxID=1396418 RepID=UPI0006790C8F|nr:hypothetical protein [Verrucomicrobium sp. BvORR034]